MLRETRLNGVENLKNVECQWKTGTIKRKEHERLLNEKTNSTEMERLIDKNSMIYNNNNTRFQFYAGYIGFFFTIPLLFINACFYS